MLRVQSMAMSSAVTWCICGFPEQLQHITGNPEIHTDTPKPSKTIVDQLLMSILPIEMVIDLHLCSRHKNTTEFCTDTGRNLSIWIQQIGHVTQLDDPVG